MLHIRYDWRRPVFWSALCLSFFLSSQKGYSGKDVAELVKTTADKKIMFSNNAEQRMKEKRLPGYFYIANR